jgi:hypothetical protein
MNKPKSDSSFELYNFILNALIALELEKCDRNLSQSSSSKTLFLGAWLKKAKKQKRYPKVLVLEVENLINIYTLKGRNANLSGLFNKMVYEYMIIKGVSSSCELPDKIRFDAAMTALSKEGWHISLPVTHDIAENSPYRATQAKEIFTSKQYWKGAFDKQQTLSKEVSIFVVSSPQQVIDKLYQHGFVLIKGIKAHDVEGKYYYQYIIFPDNKCTGAPAIPSWCSFH